MPIRRLWFVIASVCLVFIFAQVYFLQKITPDGKAGPGEESLANLKEFLDICSHLSVPIIVVDKEILWLIHSNKTQDLCFYFCQKRVISFAVVNTHLEPNAQFLSRLKSGKFQVWSSLALDAKLAAHNINISIATHHVITKGNTVMHLVILHERIGKFWWHGSSKPLLEKHRVVLSNLGVYPPDFQFSAEEGAYDIFETVGLNVEKRIFNVPRDIDNFAAQTETSEFVECNHSRAKIFAEKYGEDKSDDANEFKEIAMDILRKAIRALTKLQVPFWLSSGTCLGFFRQCGIITYSRDVDIGIFAKDYHPLISQMLVSRGLRLMHTLGRVNDSFEMSFTYRDVKLDIFFFYEESDHFWNGGTQVKTGKKFKYVFPPFKLCWTDFNDLKVRIPCETRKYVEANYGRDWFKPVRDWDWKRSPPNVRPNGVWTQEERHRVIQQFPLDDSP